LTNKVHIYFSLPSARHPEILDWNPIPSYQGTATTLEIATH